MKLYCLLGRSQSNPKKRIKEWRDSLSKMRKKDYKSKQASKDVMKNLEKRRQKDEANKIFHNETSKDF